MFTFSEQKVIKWNP